MTTLYSHGQEKRMSDPRLDTSALQANGLHSTSVPTPVGYEQENNTTEAADLTKPDK